MKELLRILHCVSRCPVVWVVLVGGCMPPPVWKTLTPTPVALTPDRNQRVQIWTHGDGVHYWYAVVINADSIEGIPYQTGGDQGAHGFHPRPYPRDTLPHSIPRTAVDSIRLAFTSPWDAPVTILYLGAIIALVVTTKT